jgi:hypothetical protein
VLLTFFDRATTIATITNAAMPANNLQPPTTLQIYVNFDDYGIRITGFYTFKLWHFCSFKMAAN